jgi:hypothetical protein
MTCSKCGYCFCWVCGDDWATHGDHFTCNKFDGKIGQGSGLDIGQISEKELNLGYKGYTPEPIDWQTRLTLQRYAHYRERWEGHRDSAIAEKRARANADVAGWIARFTAWTTPARAKEMLIGAYKVIDDARQVLIWTYPYAYSLRPGSPQLSMFETRQGHLEMTNERVVRIVEQTWQVETPGELDRCIELLERYKKLLLDEVAPAHGAGE